MGGKRWPAVVEAMKSSFVERKRKKKRVVDILDVLICYLWSRPYTSNKLDSNPSCVFVGSSWLDSSSSKIYVSRHVKFIEHEFPISTFSMSSPSHTTIQSDELCALQVTIMSDAPLTKTAIFSKNI
ncbi:hypothetical protein OSB04_018313 [Centaurea solstitialis]|uniref:Uncharacterized protein n=1 Tax=Centaurea solstitialis TaxID=347529 RepID=A0AA38TC56_9ASTR|nr:hypothetical protein OSB04_018313 [Centaurea solstitialis]